MPPRPPTTAQRLTAIETQIPTLATRSAFVALTGSIATFALKADSAKTTADATANALSDALTRIIALEKEIPAPAPVPTPEPTPTPSPVPTPAPVPGDDCGCVVPVPVPLSPTEGFAATSLTPNQNSCVVEFSAVPGAVDYCVYDKSHLHGGVPLRKYSGGGLRIEINGLDPKAAVHPDYVIEALDALGPYEHHDGNTPHSAMHHKNGQGPSTNTPRVIATSAPFKPRTQAQRWPTQPGAVSLFRDTFDDTSAAATTFTVLPTPVLTPLQAAMNLEFYGMWQTRYASKNWLIDFLGHERGAESIFIHQRHLMDILIDGEKRNNNASSVLQPLVDGKPIEFDLADGKVVHITWEVDAFNTSRRWTELQLKPADETFLNPGKFQIAGGNRSPTESGRLIRWQPTWEAHKLDVFGPWIDGKQGTTTEEIEDGREPVRTVGSGPWEHYRRTQWDKVTLSNGTIKDLDFRHKFDLYLSEKEYLLFEDGVQVKHGVWKTPLPFTKMNPGFIHQVYHTAAEGSEGGEPFYQEHHEDERHWGNLGLEIVPAFPK